MTTRGPGWHLKWRLPMPPDGWRGWPKFRLFRLARKAKP